MISKECHIKSLEYLLDNKRKRLSKYRSNSYERTNNVDNRLVTNTSLDIVHIEQYLSWLRFKKSQRPRCFNWFYLFECERSRLDLKNKSNLDIFKYLKRDILKLKKAIKESY